MAEPSSSSDIALPLSPTVLGLADPLWPRAVDSVAEVGPNYTLLRGEETKAMRRKGDVDIGASRCSRRPLLMWHQSLACGLCPGFFVLTLFVAR